MTLRCSANTRRASDLHENPRVAPSGLILYCTSLFPRLTPWADAFRPYWGLLPSFPRRGWGRFFGVGRPPSVPPWQGGKRNSRTFLETALAVRCLWLQALSRGRLSYIQLPAKGFQATSCPIRTPIHCRQVNNQVARLRRRTGQFRSWPPRVNRCRARG